MTLQKLTYNQKTNPKPVIDRTKQATAEDFNEIKDVVNPAIDKINEFDDIIEGVEGSGSKKSFANVAAATSYYNDAGTNPKPDDGILINIEDTNKLYKWASGEASRVLFVKDNISAASIAAVQQSADDAQDAANAAQGTANNAMQNAAIAQQSADDAADDASDAQEAANDAQSIADGASNRVLSLINSSDSKSHAYRVSQDGGTTIDIDEIENQIKPFRKWKWLLLPFSRKAGKVYSIIPDNSGGDASFSRSTGCGVIDKNGQDQVQGTNLPRFDYKKPYVHDETNDESYYEFSGENTDQILLDNNTVGNLLPKSDFYIFGWINPNSYPDAGSARIFGKGGTGNGTYGIYLNNNGHIMYGVRNATSQNVAYSTQPIPLNAWTFIEYVREYGGTGRLYINGVEDDTYIDNGYEIQHNSIALAVSGIYILSGNWAILDAKIKRVGLWNVLPTDQERADNMNGLPIPEKYKGVVARDLITNGDFNGNANSWNLGAGWVYDNNGALATNANTTSIYQANIFEEGYFYRIDFEISDYTNGALYAAYDGGGTGGVTVSANGSYSHIFEAVPRPSPHTSLFFYARPDNGGFSGRISNIKVHKLGSVVELSAGKSEYGPELVQNRFFDDTTNWNTGTGWSIVGGQASSNGSQSGWSNLSQLNILSSGKNYAVKIRIESISAGGIVIATGSSSSSALITEVGNHEMALFCSGDPHLYIQANADFIGIVDNISVREINPWYDLDHGQKCQTVRAILRKFNGFGAVEHDVEKQPAFLFEPSSVINSFLNSDTPVTQTITGLTIGTTYTVNFKGKGVVQVKGASLITEGGSATETRPLTFVAKETSYIVYVPADLEWLNFTNSKIPFNHISTQGSSVSKVIDSLEKTGLQNSGYIGEDTGSWFIEFGRCNLSKRSSGSPYLSITESFSSSWESSFAFWTAGSEKIRVGFFNGNVQEQLYTTDQDISYSKVLITWKRDTAYLYINGILKHTFENMRIRAFDRLLCSPLNDSYFTIRRNALSPNFTGRNEAIEKTT